MTGRTLSVAVLVTGTMGTPIARNALPPGRRLSIAAT